MPFLIARSHSIFASLILMLVVSACGAAAIAPTPTDSLTTTPSSSPDVRATGAAGNVATIWANYTATAHVKATGQARAYATATAEAPVNNATSTAGAVQTATMIANLNGFSTQQAATVDASPALYLLSPWPASPFTDVQITQARTCDIEALYALRYEIASDLEAAFFPRDACDFAVLAAGYVMRAIRADNDTPLPPEAVEAFSTAIYLNPAMMFKNWLVLGYVGTVDLIEPPPISSQPLVSVHLDFEYIAMGSEGELQLDISQGNTDRPLVSGHFYRMANMGTPDPASRLNVDRDLSGTVNPALVQSLGNSLSNLVPIQAPAIGMGCSDYYPEWTVTLTYEDGTTIRLTNFSTLLFSPWQTTIDHQAYLQYGYGFSTALNNLFDALDIQAGLPTTVDCGSRNELLDDTYP